MNSALPTSQEVEWEQWGQSSGVRVDGTSIDSDPVDPPSFQRKPCYSTASILMNVARRSASAFVRSAGMFVTVTTQSVLIGIEEL